jgi:hypothetical protein
MERRKEGRKEGRRERRPRPGWAVEVENTMIYTFFLLSFPLLSSTPS